MKREPVFVVVRLSDNTEIGGAFSTQSQASSYPLPEQIYLEQVWSLDEEGRFDKPIENSKGNFTQALKHFSKVNEILLQQEKELINWQL